MNTRNRQPIWVLLIVTLLLSSVVGFRILTRRFGPDQMLSEAIRDANHADPVKFVFELDEILRLYPDHLETLLERESLSSSAEESLDYLARIQQGPPEKVAGIRLREGDLLLELHRVREAEAAFRQAIALSPKLQEPRQRLIPVLALQRRPEAFREQLQALRSIRKLMLSEMAWLIAADEQLTPFDDAIVVLNSYLAADADDQASLRGMCMYLAEETRTGESVDKLQTALKENGNVPETVALLGQVLLNSGRTAEAAELLSDFSVSRESTVLQWETLAQHALAVGDLQRGRVAAEFAARNSPFKRSAAYLYFRFLTELGDGKNADIWRTRVDLLNSLHTEVDWVGISINRQIADPGPVLRVAEILLQLDLPQEAQDWIQAALSIGGPNELTRKLQQECSERLVAHHPVPLDPPLAAWNSSRPESPPLLSGSDEPVVAAGSAGIQLKDGAMQTGLIMNYENGQTGFKYLIETTGAGVGVIDFDNDGWPDLYCPQGGSLGDGPRLAPLSDQLFRNHSGKRFVDVTVKSGFQEYGYSQGIACRRR